jgi:hypothetical protein
MACRPLVIDPLVVDSHPEIAEQLRKVPSLIDNRQRVANQHHIRCPSIRLY